jgi:hypothetical protein
VVDGRCGGGRWERGSEMGGVAVGGVTVGDNG